MRIRILPLLVVAAVLAVGGARIAGAHAVLLSTDPAAGSTLPVAPGAVTLHFSETVEIAFGAVTVYDPTGTVVETGDARYAGGDSSSIEVTLPAGLGDGTYTVGWRVISADSHPVSGAFTFHIGAPGGSQSGLVDQLRSQGTDRTVERAGDIARSMVFGGLLLAVGLVAFAVVVARGRPAPAASSNATLVVVALAVALAGTLAAYALEGAAAAGKGLGAAADASLWDDLAGTRYGRSSLVRLALIAAALVVALAPAAGRWRRPLVLVLAVGAMASVSFGGHASTVDPAWAGRLGDTVHQVAAGAWFGGLVALVLALRRTADPGERRALGKAFSRLALLAVALVVVTGVLSGLWQLDSPGDLFSSRYGSTLLIKVGVVALAVGIGAANRFVVIPRMGGRDSLVRTAGVEAALLLGVVAVTGVLTGTAPPSGAAPAAAPTPAIPRTITVEGPAGPLYAFLELTPATTGANSFHLHLAPSGGEEVTIEELSVTFRLPSAALGPLPADLEADGPYAYDGSIVLSLPGEWEVTVRVRTSPFDAWTVEGTFSLP